MPKFLHFWKILNGHISSTRCNCCFGKIVVSDFAIVKTDQFVMSMLFHAFWIIPEKWSSDGIGQQVGETSNLDCGNVLLKCEISCLTAFLKLLWCSFDNDVKELRR